MSVKIHLMLNSKVLINGAGDSIVATSLLEASNLIVLKESSVIHSNANLGVHGQGFLNLSGPGNLIEAQHLILSLFYGIHVEPGSVLRGPLEAADNNSMTPQLSCELANCPVELLHPPEDCNVNSTLAFTLQICRVEDVIVEGTITGSVVHFHWVRNVDVHSGAITVSGLGCTGGLGRGRYYENGLGGGGGHGGIGGDGYYNGNFIEGGTTYGDVDLPCELGSGSGNNSLAGSTAGGGIIVMGSLEHSLSSLTLKGSLRADGESFGKDTSGQNGRIISGIGPGGGSGGTILLFVQSLVLEDSSVVSAAGGHGSPSGGGGGGGGRVHFHWSDIPVGDEYIPLASVKGAIHTGGGFGGGRGLPGKNGTISGRSCPKGLYGIFCEECPVGTYKNSSGSDRALCHSCPPYELPRRAIYTSVRGGVTEIPCPYNCISERYHMPNCYTAFEELVYTFGGPWFFGLLLLGLLVLLALVLSAARMKYVGGDDLPTLVPAQHDTRINSFPFLESLNEIIETNRSEESQSHVHRLYFQGSNSFGEPWHLSHCLPEQVKDIVYEDAFNRFVDDINILATYHWWEGSIYSLLCIIAYPLAWSWLQKNRRKKLQQLREFVRSEYDHACLRSCRSRALYEGLKVAATSDLVLAYLDFFLGGDEKRSDLPPHLHQRFPMPIIFGGDGSYMAPFSIQSDNILTSIMSQSVPPTIWYRFVAGLNAQLRLVRRGHLKITLRHIVNWLDLYAHPTLGTYGVHVDLAWFQPTASEYCQFGLVVRVTENESTLPSLESYDESRLMEKQPCLLRSQRNPEHQLIGNEHMMTPRRMSGGIVNSESLRTLKEKKTIYCPFAFIICNTKPVGHQDLVGLFISILLLGDLSLMFLTILQMYSLSLLNFFLVLFVLPFGVLFPFPSGICALFSQGPRRSAGLARLYALWNFSSLVNVVVAFICGFIHYYTTTHSNKEHSNFQSWSFSMDESEWWMLPSGLVLCKIIQARLIDRHVANQEIQDPSLYSSDPNVFWHS
ncbi:putative transmembrane protein [Senna tora]|uniref:Putative transmembrane protein n=1 Tax=Senna tora TaxID=362788 RepID=A0A834TDD8_9FABA|nr:putative transmembrane protein [Senna tora]